MERSTDKQVSFSGIIILMVILSCMGVTFLPNGVYLLSCLVTLYVILFLLWRSSRPGIIVFAFLLQWAQVVAYVIWMNNASWDINQLSKRAGIAVVESCIGLIVMAAVVSMGISSLPVPSKEEFYKQASLINEKKILILYAIATFSLGSLGFLVGSANSFAQILLTLYTLKWVFFLVYGYVCWINKKNRVLLTAIIVFEFATALYSYFSSFKEVILITIILVLTFIRTISFRQLVNSVLIGFLLCFLLLTWTAIKSDYRQFLNQGKKQQVVEVTRTDAFGKIADEISNLTWESYQFSISLFLYRLQYVYHLAKTMDRVPEIIPFEYGKIWWDNISYVLVPRIIYPDKPIFEATKKTVKYTGINYAGNKQGVSFSLGYFADSYIDFGYIGMFIPLALIALFIVFIYRTLYRFKKINILIRFALINIALYDFTTFESDGLFLFGRLLLMFLVFWFYCKTVIPRIQTWLYKK